MRKKKINILIADPITATLVSYFPKSKFNVNVSTCISNEDILKLYSGTDCLIIRSTRKIDRKFLSAFRGNLIATCSRGFDHIDIKCAETENIKIIYSLGANSVSAAEHTFAMILNIYKKIHISDSLVRNGKFTDLSFERNELEGKKIGIVGLGQVGRRVANFSKAFGMEIFFNDTDKNVVKSNPQLRHKTLKWILRNCDIVTVHIPLNKKNYRFFTGEKLSLMRRKSIFINTSRGAVVDENALIKLLQKRKIKYAGLDVFLNEPHINNIFFNIDNVLLTNHTAGKTKESSEKTASDIYKQVTNFYIIN